MNDSGLKKIKARTAAEVCRNCQLSDDAKALLKDSSPPEEFLNLLVEAGLFRDAVSFIAQALPNREATWWACVSARSALGKDPATEVVKMLEAAEQWVYKPTDENRRLAMAAAEAAGFETPAAWAAVAAFWSDGSMAPPDAPVIAPAEDLNGKAVVGAVMLAAVVDPPQKAAERYRVFIDQGLDIARGGSGRMPGSSEEAGK